jgi:hypothetical protein
LLVSRWYVNSDATVALIKGALEESKVDPKIGRAEALRRSMLALIDKGPERFAHPAAWAPFVVVGEGGVGRSRLGISRQHLPTVALAYADKAPSFFRVDLIRDVVPSSAVLA